MPFCVLEGASGEMIPSRWVGRVVLTTMCAVVLANLSMTMPLFAVGTVDNNGHIRNEAVVHKDYIQNNLVLVRTAMMDFTAMIWIWMLLALIFVGLLLFNNRWGSVIHGWVLVINGMVALSSLTAKLGAASGDLVFGPYVKGFYGHVTSSSGVEWAWGPELGWWFLVIAVVLQTLAVAMRTYAVFHEYQVQRAWIGPPPVQDVPKLT
jgi:hypothetical protein